MMKMMRNILIILLLLATSCSKDKGPASTPYPDYLPVSQGRFNDFDVTFTTYSESVSPDIRQYVTRQAIADSFTDINNQLVYKTEHFILNNDIWKLDSVTTLWRTKDKIMCQENGKPVIKMLFPLSDGASWNGNYYNNLNEVIFRCVNTGKPFRVNSLIFPETVTIIRQDDSTLLSKRKYIEIYARDVGLIKTEKTFLQYCSTPDCRGKGIVQSGWTELSTIKNFEK